MQNQNYEEWKAIVSQEIAQRNKEVVPDDIVLKRLFEKNEYKSDPKKAALESIKVHNEKPEEVVRKLTKENFWDRVEKDFPNTVEYFYKWMDNYKKRTACNALFGAHLKFHELPIAMQHGIWISFLTEETLMLENDQIILGHNNDEIEAEIEDALNYLEQSNWFLELEIERKRNI